MDQKTRHLKYAVFGEINDLNTQRNADCRLARLQR